MYANISQMPDKNVIKKEAKKILKYKDLTTEMGNVKTKVAPVIMEPSQTHS
jgi:hypothetical protein